MRWKWLRREALTVGLAASVLGHVVAARAIADAPPPRTAEPPSELDFVSMDPLEPDRTPNEPVLDTMAVTSPPQPVAPAALPPRPSPQPAALPTSAPTSATNEAASAPVALTGVTLSGTTGAWSTTLGNGVTLRGPLGPVGGGRRGSASAKAPPARNATAAPRPPAEVPLRDLSEKPVAPNLNGSLRRLYPVAAREQRVSGQAVVRLRVGPSGSVTSTHIGSETFPGFGAACRAAVQGSMWSVPRDRAGRAVATWVLFRCNFQLER